MELGAPGPGGTKRSFALWVTHPRTICDISRLEVHVANLSSEELKQKDYYNSIASTYDHHYANSAALDYRFALYDRVLQGIDLHGKTVFDAMCGSGEGTAYLRRQGANVVGLDISEECCELYRERFPDGHAVCGSILETEFENNHFDFILTDSLHHIPPHLQRGLKELQRVLKPGGHLCCWEPNADSLLNTVRRLWYRIDATYFEENEDAIDMKELERLIAKDFTISRCTYGGNLAYLLVNCSMVFRIPVRVVKWYAPFLISFERLFGFQMPRAFSLWVLGLLKKNG